MKNLLKFKIKTSFLLVLLVISFTSFADLIPPISNPDTILRTGWYYVSDTQTIFKRQLDRSSEYYFIEPSIIVNVNQFTKFERTYEEFKGKKYPELIIRFDSTGTKNWSFATEKSIGRRLALIINNKLIIVPKVNSKITVGVCIISRIDFTDEDIEEILRIIRFEQK